jgi:hypothetical protein
MVGFYLLLQVGSQAAQVGNTLMLGFWSGDEIAGFSMGEYMAVYAGTSIHGWEDLLSPPAFGVAIAILVVREDALLSV